MTANYDLAVVGTGTAASAAADRCRSAGWRVAIVDHQPFGGTCALRGCDPKKVLVGAAEAVDHARRMLGKGVFGKPAIDWAELIGFKRTFTTPIPELREKSFASAGIDAFHGRARFLDAGRLDIGGSVIESRFVLLAVGATPVRLGIPGEEHVVTSTEFLELDRLPNRIVLIGGGYIAAEFAHIAARGGAAVTILQRADRMLTRFDPDLVDWLMEKFREIGIEVRLRTRVKAVDREGGQLVVHARSDREERFAADLVVHAAGRAPDLEPLDLAKAGIDSEHGRVKLNEFLQSTSNPAVYAAGDAAAKGPPLTPVAAQDGKIVAANMLKGNHQRPNYLGIPSVAFTIPPIASVGLAETQAHEHGRKFRVAQKNASDWYTARRVAERIYGFKVLIEEDSDRILGAHLVGPEAEQVINIFALAIRNGLTAEDLRNAIFAYPTGASDIADML
jgi:glutathione reductase (NADPH)